jgi:hypothetical protein
MTWALGQHPNLLPLEETGWLAKFAADLRNTYQLGRQNPMSQLGGMGIKLADFYEAFGKAANDLILSWSRYDSEYATSGEPGSPFQRYRSPLDPKTRWVDGTPKYSLGVFELFKLFPEARFIHMLRDVRQVANSLEHFDRVGASARSTEAAYSEWYGFVRACFDAERAFGSRKVMRLRHADLASDPTWAVRRCLDFLEEPFSPACLEPLEQVINTSSTSSDAVAPAHERDSVIAKALGLSEQLLAEEDPYYEPDVGLQGELKLRSPLSTASYLLPVDGPIFQEGPAGGFCDDFWIDGSLTATMRATDTIRKLTIEGRLPAISDVEDVTLQLTIDENEVRETFTAGQHFSWTVPFSLARSRKAELTLGSSHTWCPRREGLSNDERELAFSLKRMVFSP